MSDTQNIPEPKTQKPLAGQVADATQNNWVDRLCPVWSRPYLRLSRADRPAGTWLLLIPCWWGLFLALWASGTGFSAHNFWFFIAFALGAFLMRGAGCTWNDVTDRHIDAEVTRTKSRPIPSGQVSVKAALFWMIIQAFLAFAILLTFNGFSILLGIAALVPVAIYPFAKRFTWWPQVFLGIAFNWGALMGWAVIFGHLDWAAVVLYAAGICWTLFYDTIYALQDKEDDALLGVKSTARLFGATTKLWLRGFVIATLCLMAWAVSLAFVPSLHLFSLLIVIAGVWSFGWHMVWQLGKLDIEDAEICLKLFRSNRDAGLIVVAALALAIVVQILLGAA